MTTEYTPNQLNSLLGIRGLLFDVGIKDFLDIPLFCFDLDRQKHSKLFEYTTAFQCDGLIWEHLSPDFLESKHAFRQRDVYTDQGVDVINPACPNIAYQSKLYAPGSTMKKNDIAGSYAYSHILRCNELKVVSSQDVRFPPQLEGLKGLGVSHEVIDDEKFRETLVRALKLEIGVDKGKEEIVELKARAYQDEAYQAVYTGLFVTPGPEKCVTMKMVCGSGKSVVIALLARGYFSLEEHGMEKWALMVPNLHLLGQMKKVLEMWCGGIRVSLVGDGEKDLSGQIIISTYHSVKHLKELEYALVVVDEGHHLEKSLNEEREESDTDEGEGESEGEEEESSDEEEDERGGYLRKICKLKTRKILLTSATLDEDDSRPCLFRYDLERGISEGFLTDYNIAIPVLCGEKKNDRKPALTQLIKENLFQWNHILAYCNRREEAERFCALLRELNVSCAYIDGRNSVMEREQVFNKFLRGEIRVLSTVNILKEGVDLPSANCAILVEPRGSSIDIIQILGRILRKCDAKVSSTIVLPTTDEDAELRHFLKVISNNDRRIKASLMGQGRGKGRLEVIIKGEDNEVKINEIRETLLYDRFGGMITRNAWVTRYEELKDFQILYNRMPYHRSEDLCEKSLYHWCREQKKYKRCLILQPEKITLLNQIPGWHWDKVNLFDQKLEALSGFVLANSIIPSKGEIVSGFDIGIFAYVLRTSKRNQGIKKCRYKLTKELIERIEKIPGWFWDRDLEGEWNYNLTLFVEFYNLNGRVPQTREKYGNANIGAWVNTQQYLYKKGSMDKERVKALEDTGVWFWHKSKIEIWWENRDKTLSFWRENNRLPTRKEMRDLDTDGWTRNQMKRYKNEEKPMDPNLRAALEEIPGWATILD